MCSPDHSPSFSEPRISWSVQASLLVAGGFTALTVGHRFFRDHTQEPQRSAISDLRAGLDLTRRTPLLRLMTGAAVLISALFFLMVFPFAEIVTQSFATEVEIANFLGLFSALATAATFLVSLLGVNRLFARIGVVLTLLILPVVYLVGFATWLASFGLATAVPVRGSQWIAVNAIGFDRLERSVQRRPRSATRRGHGFHVCGTHPGGDDGGRRAAHRRVRAVGRPDQRHRLGAGRGTLATRAEDALRLLCGAGRRGSRRQSRSLHSPANWAAEAAARRRRPACTHR